MSSYEVLETLPPSDRYQYEKVSLQVGAAAVTAFRKSSADEAAARSILNQAETAHLIDEVGAQARPSFRAPAVYDYGPGYIVTEWLSTTPLSETTTPPSDLAVTLAGMLQAFDEHGPKSAEPPRFSFTEPFEVQMARFRRELAAKVGEGLVDEALVQRSLQFLADLYPSLTSCLQHADLTPKHIYPDPLQRRDYVLIDSEHLRTTWPRYYDLGNLIAKYTIGQPRPELARDIVRQFVRLSGTDPQTMAKPLTAALLVRSLAFIKLLTPPLNGWAKGVHERAPRSLIALTEGRAIEGLT